MIQTFVTRTVSANILNLRCGSLHISEVVQDRHKLQRNSLTVCFCRTTQVSWHQKGQTSLDFNEARDDGVAGISWTTYRSSNHLHLTPEG